MTTDRVRDAMISDPRALPGTASAQEAGGVLTPPEVRAVYVVDADGALTGVLTRKTLVAKVVAAGLDPGVAGFGGAEGSEEGELIAVGQAPALDRDRA